MCRREQRLGLAASPSPPHTRSRQPISRNDSIARSCKMVASLLGADQIRGPFPRTKRKQASVYREVTVQTDPSLHFSNIGGKSVRPSGWHGHFTSFIEGG
jgi:hypothetical protein